ncbi:calcium and integrin-binding protein 1 [Trichonephila clavipes]|nr:calcium and integrin-binding protein 1 [Trichonephila clavipes]
MIRVFAWILRFVNNCRKDYNKCKEHELSVAEIENSEKQLIRLSQTYYLPDVESLKLVTFIDNDNILRVKSKITERNDESSFLYPILLPDKCEFTKLLIRSIHKKNCHAGIQIMQSLIRERFWIIRARKTIKSILNEYFICARFKVKSLSSGPSPLPPDRVNDCAIFEVVGIDLAGPLFLKTGEKVWITLFTCAVYRALHLELVNALSSDAFLLALRRFIARRGRPRIIYCDNGTNFRGAFNDLAKLDWHKISRETSTQKIVWKFIPPTAAWWGGWWERLVRIIKELLRRSLGKSISVKSTKPEKVLNTNDAIVKKYTSGKFVKEPKRLDLLNYNCYRFETLPKSQRGGVNPFKDRMIWVFTDPTSRCMTFEDYLDMMSVFSERAPLSLKAEYAFKIYDFDDDDLLSRRDLREILNRLKVTENGLKSQDCEEILDCAMEDGDIDEDGFIAFTEFSHLMQRVADFASTFVIHL